MQFRLSSIFIATTAVALLVVFIGWLHSGLRKVPSSQRIVGYSETKNKYWRGSTATYKCGHCQKTTPFSLDDRSSFNAEDKEYFDTISGPKAKAYDSYHIDFYCAKCNRPVRIVAGSFDYAHGGARQFWFDFVIEQQHLFD